MSVIEAEDARAPDGCYKQPVVDEDPTVLDARRLGARIRALRKARGLTLEQVAKASGTKHGPLSQIERGERNPSIQMLHAIAVALGVKPSAFWEEPDPTAADPEPVEDPVAGEHRGAIARSLPVETFVHAGGLVDGSLAIDVITRPSGKSGELLKKRHAQRSDRSVQTEHLLIEGVPIGCELIRAEAAIELRDQDPPQLIPKGVLLVVDRRRRPASGQLVVAVKNVNQRETEELPDVRLFRYHQTGPGWSLMAIDGSHKTYGSGEGWEVVATVLWWRSAP
jgi:transcriptional regulator with XRE-family HTH domain